MTQPTNKLPELMGTTSVPEPQRSNTADRYLETIYCLAGEGETVRPSRIAEWLHVSAPTVSVTLQKLAHDGWIEVASNRSVSLTTAGESAATATVRRHRILERWLTDVLGFDWVAAHIEADKLGAAMSDEVLNRLDEALGQPTTCPHGNVIPGREVTYGELISLADLEPGKSTIVRRISEILEHEALQVLYQLEANDIRPGSTVEVSPGDGSVGAVAVSVGQHSAALGIDTARLIWVEAVDAEARPDRGRRIVTNGPVDHRNGER